MVTTLLFPTAPSVSGGESVTLSSKPEKFVETPGDSITGKENPGIIGSGAAEAMTAFVGKALVL